MNRWRFAPAALRGVLCWLVGAALLASGVQAQERILSFDSVIRIAVDGSMIVEDSLRVRAEGVDIRRGIFREFPTRYEDRFGNRVVVDFEVLGVERDGRPEPWFTERRLNGVRVYIGDENTQLEPAVYNYTLRYRTNRQLGYFGDHDELYWNVTGDEWGFAIEAVSARVTLPADVVPADLSMEGYTGAFGEAGRDFSAETFTGGAVIRTTRPLAPGEGLTLVMTWPKGVVTEPSRLQRIGWLLSDNLGLLLATATCLLIVGYLLAMWFRYGRDPAPGVIFPHYEPPAGYSPASSRYISRMGYDNRALTAAIINLAVKGYLEITREGNKDYRLRQKTSEAPLAAGERQLLAGLFAEGAEVELDNSNHRLLARARDAHAAALKRDYQGIYFRLNSALLLPCIAVLVFMLLGVFALNRLTPAVVVLAVFSGLCIALFGWLLKAPTPKGRLLMDRLDGFRQYLEVAEKDDLHLKHPPELTPELFERYLPFAIALGVEQPWAERFARVFAGLSGQSAAYQPAWYHGQFSSRDLGGFSSSLGKGFTSAISSASQPPGSSSGSGGGGFSGGGGGGGGGGGW